MLKIIPLIASLSVAMFLAAACSGAPNSGGQTSSLGAANAPVFAPLAHPAAGPRNWQVGVGGERRHQALQALDFFPGSITIDVGDSVTWTVEGNAHTITFLGPLSSFPPGDNPNSPFGGSTYDGSVLTSSGAMFPGNKYALTFTKAGTYPYMCLFHPPEMVGVIVVQSAGTPYPHSQGFYNGRGLAEENGQLRAAQESLREFPYRDRGPKLVAGIAPGLAGGAPSTSTVLRFLDSDTLGPGDGSNVATIAVGGTLAWVNQSNNEPHTVTFPPAGQGPPAGDPFMPGTGPLTGQTYDGTALVNSGPFFPGQEFTLTFTKAGTYVYFCLIHDFIGMEGVVIVK